jgi:hypothetical protein
MGDVKIKKTINILIAEVSKYIFKLSTIFKYLKSAKNTKLHKNVKIVRRFDIFGMIFPILSGCHLSVFHAGHCASRPDGCSIKSSGRCSGDWNGYNGDRASNKDSGYGSYSYAANITQYSDHPVILFNRFWLHTLQFVGGRHFSGSRASQSRIAAQGRLRRSG